MVPDDACISCFIRRVVFFLFFGSKIQHVGLWGLRRCLRCRLGCSLQACPRKARHVASDFGNDDG